MPGIRRSRYRDADRIAQRLEMVVFDFDGVFTDNRVLVLQDGTEGVLCSRADGFGLDRLGKLGIKMFVLSKEKNPVVGARCKKLKIPCIQGCDQKADTLIEEAERFGISLENVAYLGNDINDLECLAVVGLPACVADAYPEVLAVSKFITVKKGGEGAVREFCDYIASLRKGE
jgi:YrbI family 3-deoxy-D-manno-octulosonate 8-phosphate phosphatase